MQKSTSAAVGSSEFELSEAQERLARHSGAVSTHMQKAIIGILTAAGIEAVEDTDDLRPITVRVVSR